MSAKNIPPTLDKIDKIACKACRRAPYALKKKTKTTKGLLAGILLLVLWKSAQLLAIYIGYCRNLSLPIGSMQDIDSSTIYVAQLLIPFKSACVQMSANSFVAKKEAESYYSQYFFVRIRGPFLCPKHNLCLKSFIFQVLVLVAATHGIYPDGADHYWPLNEIWYSRVYDHVGYPVQGRWHGTLKGNVFYLPPHFHRCSSYTFTKISIFPQRSQGASKLFKHNYNCLRKTLFGKSNMQTTSKTKRNRPSPEK